MNRAGRKPKFPIETLKEKLNLYVREYPNKQIKFSDLANFTDIPYYVWRDNIEIKELIQKLNNPKVIIDTSNMKFELPSADEILEKNFPNKNKLLSAISDLLNLTSSLYEKAILGEHFKSIEDNYKIKLKEQEVYYKNELKKAKLEIEKLNHEIDCLYIDSRNALKRKREGIKDNMIDISLARKKSISKNKDDIMKEFESLFD